MKICIPAVTMKSGLAGQPDFTANPVLACPPFPSFCYSGVVIGGLLYSGYFYLSLKFVVCSSFYNRRKCLIEQVHVVLTIYP